MHGDAERARDVVASSCAFKTTSQKMARKRREPHFP